jgi:hypothetical protein
MRRRRFLPMLTLALFALVAGCESSTDIEDVTAQGRWDGVGALQSAYPEVRLELTENADGVITGTWRRGSQGGSAVGTNTNGSVTLQLTAFQAGNVMFQGAFTNRYRLEGSLQGAALDGPAVFRRIRF